jgi:hypothetical protein
LITQEELVVRGEKALAILNNEDLMSFVEELKGFFLECIGNTEPDDHKQRTALYYEHRALNSIIAHLVTYRETADRIKTTDSESDAD